MYGVIFVYLLLLSEIVPLASAYITSTTPDHPIR